jgi:hypothetical protein
MKKTKTHVEAKTSSRKQSRANESTKIDRSCDAAKHNHRFTAIVQTQLYTVEARHYLVLTLSLPCLYDAEKRKKLVQDLVHELAHELAHEHRQRYVNVAFGTAFCPVFHVAFFGIKMPQDHIQ